MKHILGAVAVAAVLALAGGAATPAVASPSNNSAHLPNGIETDHAAGATDVGARRRHWRRHRHVRPYRHVYPPSYGYYRPRPYYYQPYYNPGPFFSFGFGPRHYW